MFKRLVDRSLYFTLAIMFLLMCASLVFLYPDGRSFFILNGLYGTVPDFLFSYVTYIGDGLTAVILCLLLLLFYNIGSGIISLAGLGVTGLISHIMKYHIFDGSARPHLFFWQNKMIHYVPGVKINIENSFPSGHTFTAFYIFTFMALLSFAKPAYRQFILVSLAVLAAYSRVYLAQHFVGDVLAGAFLGLVFGILFYKLYTRSKNIAAFNHNLIRYFRK